LSDRGRGLVHFDLDSAQWQFFTDANTVQLSRNLSEDRFIVDHCGQLWWAHQMTINRLTSHYQWNTFDFSDSPSSQIYTLTSDNHCGIWIGGYKGLTHLDAQGNVTVFDTDNSNLAFTDPVLNIFDDGIGGWWLQGGGYLSHLNQYYEWQNYEIDTFNINGSKIISDGQGGVWILPQTGLIHFQDGQRQHYETEDTLAFRNFMSDGQGGVWLETDSNQVAHFNVHQQWQLFTLNGPCCEEVALAGHEGQNGVWLIGDSLVYLPAQGEINVYNPYNSPLPDNIVTAFTADNQGGYWLGTEKGLAHFNPKQQQWQVFNTQNSALPTDHILSLRHDNNGAVWIVSTNDEFNQRYLVHLTFHPLKTELPLLGASINAVDQSLITDTQFAGGIAINGQNYQKQQVQALSDAVNIAAHITVAPQHVHFVADIVLYGIYQATPEAEKHFFMLDGEHKVLPWDQDPAHLVAFKPGVILQAEHPITLYQGQFTGPGIRQIFLGYRLPHGLLVTHRDSMDTTIHSVLPLLGNAQAVDVLNQPLSTHASFEGGIMVNTQAYQTQVHQQLSDYVEIKGNITVDPAHVDTPANLVVYAETMFTDSADRHYYMLDEKGNILNWDQNPQNLVPFMKILRLGNRQRVPMYQGRFYYPGHLKIYFGYQLADHTLIANAQPIEVMIN